jgi:hypothetical protein
MGRRCRRRRCVYRVRCAQLVAAHRRTLEAREAGWKQVAPLNGRPAQLTTAQLTTAAPLRTRSARSGVRAS